jgi:L-ascorbate metabolism protein UlaG (beta-lactamase superfamily)
MPEKSGGRIRKRILLISLACACPVIALFVFISSAAYEYPGPPSDHFDGSCFFNPESGDHSFTDMLKWMWEMKTVSWPEWRDGPRQPPPVEGIADGRLRVTYINHATLLIQMDSVNILTDPMWSLRASPMNWIGPKRVRSPGVPIEDLPQIDYILISHDHYDHLDLPTLKTICERDHPTVLAGLGIKALLSDEGITRVVEMDWWQLHQPDVSQIAFTFVPARHGSGRWPFLENRTLWGGFVMESPSGDQVYYAGDTGFGAFIDSVHHRFTRIRLAIVPVGNYEKRWFMKNQHMNPDDAVKAHQLLDARQSIGVHFGTFAEHPEQTIDAHEQDLSTALKNNGVPPAQFWLLEFGEGRDVPPY